MNISIGFDFAAVLLLVVVLSFLLVFRQGHTKSGMVFIFICGSSLLTILCDIVCWFIDGNTSNRFNYYLNYAFNTLLIIGLLTSVVFFNFHSFYRVSNPNKRNVFMHNLTIVLYFIFVLFILVAVPFDLIFYIDKVTFVYSHGSFYYISYIFVLYLCFQNLVMVLINHKSLNLQNFIRLCFLSALPILGAIIQLILNRFIGLNTLAYGLGALGIGVIYVNDQEFAILDAGFDKMTNLRNRSNYLRMVNNEYRNLKSCGVIFFDVNNLKIVNDEFGHNIGDELIILVANSIKNLEASNITSFRIGGDEFVTIYTNCNKNEVAEYLQKWKNEMNKEMANFSHPITVAFGSSFADEDVNLDELLKEADSAMYRQKIEYKQQTKNEETKK